jgi:O-methyltransferase
VPDPRVRLEGRDWPPFAHTMIGWLRLDNLHRCAEAALREAVSGDFLEAGVWRGGASILLRAVLKAYGVTDRRVWAADSFAGLPPPNPDRYPADAGLDLHRFPQLAVSLETVRAHFARYGLLDDRVRFLKGWFRDTLPTAPVERIALLRLDGDLYESTMDALTHLYPKVSVGGFVVVDDYGDIAACRQAVNDYRQQYGIDEPIVPVDWTGAYWRRAR